jgi:hypothetical protein
MREPPDLAEAVIVTALRDGFGIHVDELVFLPVGNDAASSAYQARRQSRRAAVDGFMSLFEPGNIVDIASAS